jgi:hypothetical protein
MRGLGGGCPTALPVLALAVSADQAGGGDLMDCSTEGDEQAAVASTAIQISIGTGYLMEFFSLTGRPNQALPQFTANRVNNKLPDELA